MWENFLLRRLPCTRFNCFQLINCMRFVLVWWSDCCSFSFGDTVQRNVYRFYGFWCPRWMKSWQFWIIAQWATSSGHVGSCRNWKPGKPPNFVTFCCPAQHCPRGCLWEEILSEKIPPSVTHFKPLIKWQFYTHCSPVGTKPSLHSALLFYWIKHTSLRATTWAAATRSW